MSDTFTFFVGFFPTMIYPRGVGEVDINSEDMIWLQRKDKREGGQSELNHKVRPQRVAGLHAFPLLSWLGSWSRLLCLVPIVEVGTSGVYPRSRGHEPWGTAAQGSPKGQLTFPRQTQDH